MLLYSLAMLPFHFYLVVGGMEHRILHMLVKTSITELHHHTTTMLLLNTHTNIYILKRTSIYIVTKTTYN